MTGGLVSIVSYSRPSRGLLRDYEPSDGTFWSTIVDPVTALTHLQVQRLVHYLISSHIERGKENGTSVWRRTEHVLKKEKSCETRSPTWPADPISTPATGGQLPVGRCPRARAQPPPPRVLLLLVMVSVWPRWMCLHYIFCVSTSSDRNVGRQDVTTNKFIVIAQSNFNNLLWIWKVPPYLNFDCIYYVNRFNMFKRINRAEKQNSSQISIRFTL